ncbi:MAG TPA: NnrU family protein [Rhabdaerophilum sp.]|nr:NnrU family protein [Rhabdaerophilum sp.]
MSSLLPLVLGLVLFFAGHILSRIGSLRADLIARLGMGGYRGFYSALALAGFGLIVYGFGHYRASGMIPVWNSPRWMAHLVIPLMWASFVLLAATWLPGAIKAKAKHPMLAAVKIWAFSHLLANGDLGSILMFGSFLLWAVMARIALKKSGGTEVMPGAGTLAGGRRNDILAVLVGTGLALGFITGLHRFLIGVPILS